MQSLCRTLHEHDISLPSNAPFIIRKVLTLLDSRQCNANVFREISDCAAAAAATLGQSLSTDTGSKEEVARVLVSHLLEVVSFRAGTLRIDGAAPVALGASAGMRPWRRSQASRLACAPASSL